MENAKHILAVGSLAIDDLETPRGNRANILGGSSTYFATAASNFCPVHLVGVVGDDFPEEGLALFREQQVDKTDLQILPGKTFRWGGRYAPDYSTRDTLFTELGVFAGFQPKISAENKARDIVFLGNIQPDLQLKVAAQTSGRRLLACDTMNLWIDTALEDLLKVLKITDILLINDEEAIQLSGAKGIESAASILQKLGPQKLVIKQGSKGATLFDGSDSLFVPVFPDVDLLDPTGAGDSFAGGFLGHLSQNWNDLPGAVMTGAATASFTVSGFGVEALAAVGISEIQDRQKTIQQLTRK